MNSLDPRVKRLDTERLGEDHGLTPGSMWATFEVFHQGKRGKSHEHVGTLKAPDQELALVFAKEHYGRRQKCVNLWVVKTSDIFVFSYDDEDMFENNLEKIHREAAGYKVRDRIEEYKKRNQ